MNKEEIIAINKIKKLDIQKGDTIVIQRDNCPHELAEEIVKMLKCKIMIVDDIEKIGILKTSTFSQVIK